MKPFHLPVRFALQSASRHSTAAPIAIATRLAHGGGFVALVEARRYPCSTIVRLSGLDPDRHYRVDGADQRWCRADAAGEAMIAVTMRRSRLITLAAMTSSR